MISYKMPALGIKRGEHCLDLAFGSSTASGGQVLTVCISESKPPSDKREVKAGGMNVTLGWLCIANHFETDAIQPAEKVKTWKPHRPVS